MRILVLGQGGREHALVRALRFSSSVDEVHAAPGSDAISQEAICHRLDLNDLDVVTSLLRRHRFDLVVIGPENLLVNGLADHVRSLGVPVVGPSRRAAALEGSKIFAKAFMESAGVPTAPYVVVDSLATTLAAAKQFTPPFVLKADGLAAGKGVSICADLEELKAAAEQLFEKRMLGEAGTSAILEQFQNGFELSYLVLTNGKTAAALPLAQDHKRLGENDSGPNTGGMGVVAPIEITSALTNEIETKIVRPTLARMEKEAMLYRGVLYFGLMITPGGPSVIEYNVRFGDPEAQVILPLLDGGDWGRVFAQVAAGETPTLQFKSMSAACVVLAAPGYPEAPRTDVPIEGDLGSESSSSYFLHAGTKRGASGEWVTAGGRVLNAIGLGSNLKQAVAAAYRQAANARWAGRQMRPDIGSRILTNPPRVDVNLSS